jgi:septal ring factor EnvC (AmiA/AmiB activator)
MWPRVLMQLVELLPHVSRLVPVADRYFSSKTNNEAALTAMAEGVHADLGQVAKAHSTLYRQIQEQGAQVSALAGDLRSTRETLERSERRVMELEQRVGALLVWIRIGLSAGLVILLVILGLLLRK